MKNKQLLEKLKSEKDKVEVLMTTTGTIVVKSIDEITEDFIAVHIIGQDQNKKQIISRLVLDSQLILGYGVQGQLAFADNISNIK